MTISPRFQEEEAKRQAKESADREDNRTIKEIEKNLGLNKRKKKGTLPKSFAEDGLECILFLKMINP